MLWAEFGMTNCLTKTACLAILAGDLWAKVCRQSWYKIWVWMYAY